MTTELPAECHLIEPLTPREAEVLALLAQGLSDKEIGNALSIAPITVRGDHKQNIYDKLGLQAGFRNRKWAVHCARQLRLLAGAHESAEEMLPGENPYKGLSVFQPDDANVFFGREAFIDQLLTRLRGNGAVPRFLAVIGPSGSGKSSVVRAGLIPALERDSISGSSQWVAAIMTPHINPFHELETVLQSVSVKQQLDLLDLLQRDSYGLSRVARLILPESRPLLLIVDQFEELFTLVEDQSKARQFIDVLYAAATDPRSSVRVVITLRADFLDRPLMYPDFSWLVQTQTEMVIPLTPDELERTITLPAEQAHVTVEPGLVAKLVTEANEQPGALPLLQFALTELYDHRIGNSISLETYDEIGGLQQILAAQADRILDSFDAAQQEAARQLFLYLITLGEGTEDVRRRVAIRDLESLDVLTETMQYVTHFLAANRLLTLDVDRATREPSVEVAHETLIREWSRLRGWLEESRSDVRMERLLAGAANEWQHHNGEESYLMRGARLAQFEGWRETTDLALTDLENKFLDASIAERDRRLRQRRLLRNAAAVVVLFAAVLMGVLALTATEARNRAKESEQEALRQASIGLAAQALAELDSDTPERAVLLALEALEHYPYTPQAERALAQAVYATRPYTDLAVTGGLATTRATAFSPDGAYLVSVSAEYDAVIWDIATGEDRIIGNSYVAMDERRAYIDVDWSPDGSYFVVVAAANESSTVGAGTITVWELSNSENISTWSGHAEQDIWTVDWSSDGTFIVTGGSDNLVRIWNADTYEETQSLTGHTGSIQAVALSPDDRLLASGSSDATIRIWDAQTGETLHILSGHLGTINALDWSSDGTQIISAGDDGVAIIWDAMSGEIQQTLLGHTAALRNVDWSPDGTLVATASADGTSRIWDIVSNSVVSTLQGTSRGLSWSPDGTKLVVIVGQGTLRMWDMSQRPLRLVGHEAGLIDGKWTADDSRIVTSAFDGTARVWNAQTGELELTFSNHRVGGNPVVADISISPDSRWVATSGTDNHVRVWDVETGTERLVLPDLYASREFSSDGAQLAIASDNRILIVDVETDEILYDVDPEYGEGGCASIRMSWSPDSRYFVVPCFAQPRADIWDAQTGKHVMTLKHEVGVHASDWTLDGTRILTADASGLIHIWDAASGDLLYDMNAHTSIVWDVEISPDGSRAASGGDSGRVRIWDIETRQEVNSYDVGFSILDVYWSADGSQLLATGIRPIPDIRPVWQSTEDLIDYAYACCVFRELTPEEREQFGLP